MGNLTSDEIRAAEERLFSDDEIEKAKPKPYNVEKEEKKSFFGKKKLELHPEPKVTVRPAPRASEQKKEVTVSFSPNRVMRGVLLFLFLFFAVSFFYNPFYTLFPWNLVGADTSGVEGNVVGVAVGEGIALANQPVSPAEKPIETLSAPVVPLPEQTIPAEPVVPSAESEPTPLVTEGTSATSAAGDVTLTLEDIKTATRDWGGKVTDVSFTLENRGKAFIPKIKAYAFDEKTSGAYKASPLIKKYAVLETAKRLKATIDLSKFQFSDISGEKTVILQLYDEGDQPGFANDKKLAEIVKTVVIK
ncbi:MAG: hypothetical protein Q7R76_04585 [Candidatus Woesearchaeota archaeon]|nr:hypothetical protein [Candidatus Woesearchaeota archaeon]